MERMTPVLKINAADNVAVALADDLHKGVTIDVDGVKVTKRRIFSAGTR